MSPLLSNISEHKFSIQDLKSLAKDELDQTDQIITQALQSDVPLIETIAKHLIYAGGKRIRPLLSLICAKLFNNTVSKETLYLATAVEFIHTATLLHDDVVDDSDLRRGLQSAHRIWGNSSSILVGDYLFARAFELMVKTNNLTILQILSETSAKIASGEVLQLTHSHSLNVEEEVALKIIGSKTAELFAAACQTGALTGNATPEQALILYQYGYSLGMIFQITDDILDYTTVNNRGKNIGDDFLEGKVTLPVIYAYQTANSTHKAYLESVFNIEEPNESHFTHVLSLIEENKGFEKALSVAKKFAGSAFDLLNQLSSPLSVQLQNLLLYCLERKA